MSGFHTGFGVEAVALHPALAQANDGRALGAVDLHGEQVRAMHAGAPAAVEVHHDAVVEFKGAVGAESSEVAG